MVTSECAIHCAFQAYRSINDIYILKCPKLRDKRTDILNKIHSKYKTLSSLNTGEVFIWLMSSEDPFILRNISKLLIVLFAITT